MSTAVAETPQCQWGETLPKGRCARAATTVVTTTHQQISMRYCHPHAWLVLDAHAESGTNVTTEPIGVAT